MIADILMFVCLVFYVRHNITKIAMQKLAYRDFNTLR